MRKSRLFPDTSGKDCGNSKKMLFLFLRDSFCVTGGRLSGSVRMACPYEPQLNIHMNLLSGLTRIHWTGTVWTFPCLFPVSDFQSEIHLFKGCVMKEFMIF